VLSQQGADSNNIAFASSVLIMDQGASAARQSDFLMKQYKQQQRSMTFLIIKVIVKQFQIRST
jgi:hypothetical protein